MFVGVATYGSVKRSSDAGATWTLWSEGLPEAGKDVRQFACSSAPGGTPVVYAYVATPFTGTASDVSVYHRSMSGSVAAEGTPETEALRLVVAPNPARASATLRVTLAEAQSVRVTLTDVLGRDVPALDRALPAGASSLPLDVSRLAPGVYAARLVADGASASVRLTVAR